MVAQPVPPLAEPDNGEGGTAPDLPRLQTIEQAGPKQVRWSREADNLARLHAAVADRIRLVDGAASFPFLFWRMKHIARTSSQEEKRTS